MPPETSGTLRAATLGEVFSKHSLKLGRLLPSDVLDRLASFTTPFPASLSSFWGVEIPMENNLATADFLFCVHRPDELLNLCGLKDPFCKNAGIYNRLKVFAHEWAAGFRPMVSNIWFEYDYKQICAANYTPNLFIGPAEGLHPLEVLLMLEKFFGEPTSALQMDSFKQLFQVLNELRSLGWVSQIGQMLARQEEGFRIFVQNIEKNHVGNVLQVLRYKGNLNTGLSTWIEEASSYADKIELDFDLKGEMGNTIGIELYFSRMASALSFLDILARRKMCSPSKYRGMQTHLQNIVVNKQDDMHHFFSHFKMVFDGNQNFKTKAYLGFVSTRQVPNVFGTQPLTQSSQ